MAKKAATPATITLKHLAAALAEEHDLSKKAAEAKRALESAGAGGRQHAAVAGCRRDSRGAARRRRSARRRSSLLPLIEDEPAADHELLTVVEHRGPAGPVGAVTSLHELALEVASPLAPGATQELARVRQAILLLLGPALHEPEGGRVPERGGPAQSQQHLVALGETEELCEALAHHPGVGAQPRILPNSNCSLPSRSARRFCW